MKIQSRRYRHPRKSKTFETMTTPGNFIPMILTDEAGAGQIMAGELQMKLAISGDIAQQLDAMIPQELKEKNSRQQIQAGAILNYADFCTVGMSLFPLEFSGHKFLPLSKKYLALGTYAVVIFDPAEFLCRVKGYYASTQANRTIVDVAAVEYKNNEIDPEQYDIYARPKKDAWQREVYMTARIRPSVILGELTERQDECISIGNLFEIAVIAKTADLVAGKFPVPLTTSEYKQYIDSYSMRNKEIQGWHLSVAANIQQIEPLAKWIWMFEKFLPHEEWKAVSFLDRLYTDGDSMARLAFHKNDNVSKVCFYINHVDFWFSDYSESEKQIVEGILNSIYKECDTNFCLMSLETNADLGIVQESDIAHCSGWRVNRTYIQNNLIHSQSLEMDYRIGINPFEMSVGKQSWHYTISVSTPSNELMRWYDVSTVLHFYHNAAQQNLKDIETLMKGDVYARYHQMQRHHRSNTNIGTG